MPKSSKTTTASAAENKKIADLLAIAASAPKLTFAQKKSLSRLYELAVLEDLLRSYVASHHYRAVKVMNAPGGVLNLAGAPSRADKATYSYFRLERRGKLEHEAWVSVEVTTLSWHRSGRPEPLPPSGKHEVDVGLFRELSSDPHHPSYEELHAAFSCKHTAPTKENVREALGLRRETAYLSPISDSHVPWIVPRVPARPPSPLYLVSSNSGVLKYAEPLEALGVYMQHVPFPP